MGTKMGCAASAPEKTDDWVISLSQLTPSELREWEVRSRKAAKCDGGHTPFVSTPSSPEKIPALAREDRWRQNSDSFDRDQRSTATAPPPDQPSTIAAVKVPNLVRCDRTFDNSLDASNVQFKSAPPRSRLSPVSDSAVTGSDEQSPLAQFLATLSQLAGGEPKACAAPADPSACAIPEMLVTKKARTHSFVECVASDPEAFDAFQQRPPSKPLIRPPPPKSIGRRPIEMPAGAAPAGLPIQVT